MRGLSKLALAAIAAALLALAGCGGSDEVATEVVTESLVDPEDLPDTVIDDEDFDEFEAGSPERTFLEYALALQYGDVAAAIDYYDPGLVRAVGVDLIADGLRYGAPIYRSRKPGIVETVEAAEGVQTVRYLLQDLSGTRIPYSVSFRKEGGDWKIVFNQYLGDSIASVVQAREQARIDPAAQTPSPQAERAGIEAADAQVRFYNGVLAGD